MFIGSLRFGLSEVPVRKTIYQVGDLKGFDDHLLAIQSKNL